jgi:hypothetical protein
MVLFQVETAVISEANFEPKSVRIELDRLQQVLEQEGYEICYDCNFINSTAWTYSLLTKSFYLTQH